MRAGSSPLALPDAHVVCMFVLQRLKCQSFSAVFSMFENRKKSMHVAHSKKQELNFFLGVGSRSAGVKEKDGVLKRDWLSLVST